MTRQEPDPFDPSQSELDPAVKAGHSRIEELCHMLLANSPRIIGEHACLLVPTLYGDAFLDTARLSMTVPGNPAQNSVGYKIKLSAYEDSFTNNITPQLEVWLPEDGSQAGCSYGPRGEPHPDLQRFLQDLTESGQTSEDTRIVLRRIQDSFLESGGQALSPDNVQKLSIIINQQQEYSLTVDVLKRILERPNMKSTYATCSYDFGDGRSLAAVFRDQNLDRYDLPNREPRVEVFYRDRSKELLGYNSFGQIVRGETAIFGKDQLKHIGELITALAELIYLKGVRRSFQ